MGKKCCANLISGNPAPIICNPEKINPAVARFDIVSCPYHAMCEKYDCLELNPAFCDSDDAKYGHLHKNLKWARTGTVGKGSPCCDFRIIDISRCPDYKD